MYFSYPILVLLLWVSPSCQISRDLAYEELEELDATCNTLDTCKVRRTSDSLEKYTCQCRSYCSQLDTCCIDSRFRDRSKTGRSLTCRPVNGKNEAHYFMVDRCSSSNRDSEMEKLCRQDWNKENNLQPLVPVTSESSNVTYKNYFCFKCNEAADDFLYWNVRLNSNVTAEDNGGQAKTPIYDRTRQSWMAPSGKDGYVPVELFFDIPSKLKTVPIMCITNAIATCARQWKLRDVKRKCSQYTSYIYIIKNGINVSYKNPHCALCNFESLEKMGCGVTSSRTNARKPFSFTLLLDINRSDGEIVGKTERCESKSIWDPFFQKCRPYKCAIPGYVVKNEKCSPP